MTLDAPWSNPDGTVRVFTGDMRRVLPKLPTNHYHACVTDPPYELGFMGRGWDRSGVAFQPETWEAVLRVMRPGAHLLAFGGSRTFHRIACAIEDAGFEIRDTLMWLYGSGFPKALDVSKAIDKIDAATMRRDRQLQFTAWMREAGLTAFCIDTITNTNMGGHYLTAKSQPAVATRDHFEKLRPYFKCSVPEWVERMVDERTVESENFKRREVIGEHADGSSPGGFGEHRFTFNSRDITVPATDAAKQWNGWHSALKPAFEPIILARKPLDGTIAANVLKWGCGALNIGACRVPANSQCDDPRMNGKGTWGTAKAAKNVYEGGYFGERVGSSPQGRYPANVLHDGSPEVVGMFPSDAGGMDRRGVCDGVRPGGFGNVGHDKGSDSPNAAVYSDKGSAARFFWSPKAGRDERPEHTTDDGRTVRHPTVKPLALMEYLVRLITPPNGTILDPFAGSGSTVEAAWLGHWPIDAVDLEADHIPLIIARLRDRTEELPLLEKPVAAKVAAKRRETKELF